MNIRSLAVAALAVLVAGAAFAIEPGEGFKPSGKLRPRHAKEIAASNWSIGAETMDRDFTVYRNWKQYLGPLGAKKARLQSGWAKTEKTPGTYDWAWLDEIVNDMVAQGVEPWVCVCYGNPIYPGGGETGLGGGWPKSEEALAAWDRYVAALVSRYKDRVDEWEMWNEPSLRRGAKDAGVSYADFMIRTATIVRREQPKAKILGLSLPGMPLDFVKLVLERLKEQNKLDLLDELTYHPYSHNPDASYATVQKLRDLAASYSPTIIIRQGENGAPSIKGGFGAIANHDWTEESQAKWALRRLLGDLGRDIPTSYFSICDMKYPDRVNFKGLLAINPADKTVTHAKKGYYAVQSLTAVFDSTIQRVRDFKGTIEGAKAGQYSVFAYRSDQGGSIVTLWRSDAIPGVEPRIENVTVSLPGMRFADPVWVDLLSGEVHSIAASLWSQNADGALFKKLPAYDSPVLIAERSVLPLAK